MGSLKRGKRGKIKKRKNEISKMVERQRPVYQGLHQKLCVCVCVCVCVFLQQTSNATCMV